MQRQPRQRDEKHIKFIQGLPCIVCKDNTSTEAAHVRFADPRALKRYVGKAEKPDDKWTVPLCGKCHRTQHTMNEQDFWASVGINPLMVSLALYSVTGDHAAGEELIYAQMPVSTS